MLTTELVKKRIDDDSVFIDLIVKKGDIDVGLITYRIRKEEDNKLRITVVELIGLDDSLTSQIRILAVITAMGSPTIADIVSLDMTIFEQDLELFTYILETYGAQPTYLNNVYYINVVKDRFELPPLKLRDIPKGRGQTIPILIYPAPLEDLFDTCDIYKEGDEE